MNLSLFITLVNWWRKRT